MADEQKVCKTCQRPISPSMLAASDSARRMPMCNECGVGGAVDSAVTTGQKAEGSAAAMILLDPKRTVEYVLEAQRSVEEKDQFRFNLRVITARRWSRMLSEESEIASSESRRATLADTNLMLLRYGCAGWTGPEGSPVAAFDDQDRLSWDSLDLIPATYRVELADQIWRLNTVFERDVGFSPQP